MRIHIRRNAAELYTLTRYLSPNVGRIGWKLEWFNVLESLQGQWLDVETSQLFSDQFNTGKYRIMNNSVDQIEDDERLLPTYSYKEQLLAQFPDWLDRYPRVAFEGKKLFTFDWVAAKALLSKHFPPADGVDLKIASEIIYGSRHDCRPIKPINDPEQVWLSANIRTSDVFYERFPELRHWRTIYRYH